MIALARTAREAGVKNDRICDLIVDGLFTCMTNVNFDGQAVTALKDAVRVETAAVAAAADVQLRMQDGRLTQEEQQAEA